MVSKAEGDGKEPIDEQAVATVYSNMRADINQVYSKITELEMEVSEHSLVNQCHKTSRSISTVLPHDWGRSGGENHQKEVLPAVQHNKEGLEMVIARLNEVLEKKKKKKELAGFEAKYKISIRKGDEMKNDSSRKEGSAQGVLVGPAGASE